MVWKSCKELTTLRKVKWRFMLNFKKEEDWVNEMAKQGWNLTKFTSGRFVFMKGDPGEYIYRNELIIDKKKSEKEDYFNFLRENGIEMVHEMGGWIYLRKRTVDGDFDLFTDYQSHLNYYQRLLRIMYALVIVTLIGGISNLSFFISGTNLNSVNLIASILCLIAALLSLVQIFNARKAKVQLEKEKQLYE